MTFLRRREKRSHSSTEPATTNNSGNNEEPNVKVPRIHKCQRHYIVSIPLGVIFVALLLYLILPPPEIFLFDTYSPQQLAENLPPQCLDVAARFHQCQRSQNYTRVFACHRRWCTSKIGGHCEPCSGIGGRTHHLMQKVQEAVDNCVRIEIDFPQTDMAQLDTTVYQDAGSWLAELFRYRSYDVSQRTYHREPSSSLRSSSSTPSPRVTYSHFFEKGQFHEGPWNSFDPCLYHILFQPNQQLAYELQRHNAQIGTPSLGIHFRTGYKHMKIHTANKKNDRIQGQVGDAFEKMLDCAHQLAKQLFPREQRQSVKYFLATDNIEVKEMARTKYPQLVYTTEVIPDTLFLGGADRNALLEVLLLSQRNGLVTNVNPENNKISERLSTFHQLAQKIGFIDPNNQVMECELE